MRCNLRVGTPMIASYLGIDVVQEIRRHYDW